MVRYVVVEGLSWEVWVGRVGVDVLNGGPGVVVECRDCKRYCARESERNAMPLAEAFGPRVSVSVSVTLPPKLAAQAAKPVGEPFPASLGQAR